MQALQVNFAQCDVSTETLASNDLVDRAEKVLILVF